MNRRHLFKIVIINLGVLVFLLLSAELIMSHFESKINGQGYMNIVRDPVLGWANAPGSCSSITDEFRAYYHINSYGMNGDEVGDIEQAKARIMVVGDSFTFASGVSTDDAYPNVLEHMLFGRPAKGGRVYNCGVFGYSLGHYLLRIRQLEKTLHPNIIIVGFSMATDLYDIIPPRMGGFVYGDIYGRVYFDLDKNGKLIELYDLKGKDLKINAKKENRTVIVAVKDFLEKNSSMYRRLKRSDLALYLSFGLFKVENLWPGSATAVKKQLDETDRYRWALAEKLLEQITQEAKEKNREVIIVNIPYLPEIDDRIWKASFGRYPKRYDRFIGGVRLGEICKRIGADYLDCTPRFIQEVNFSKKTLYYARDGHLNAEGHRIIAQMLRDYVIDRKLLEKKIPSLQNAKK